jgi:molecular chaperone GrpE
VHADVSDEVIQAALRSVEGGATGGEDEGASPAAEPSAPAIEVSTSDVVGEAGSDAVLDADGLRAELRETKAALELSVERARETMDRLKDAHDRHLRAAADLENYKKRASREREEVERFGNQKLLKELLPVMDNLDRALEHADPTNVLTAGVNATRRLFEEVFARYGVKALTAVGQTFDPNLHEAMQRVVTSEAAAGTVIAEMVRGYALNGRLVRPALVSVATAPEEPKTEPKPEEPKQGQKEPQGGENGP